ncbi:hypothetical protein V6N13_049955 [Hibiscus sabdariffa]|uniref:Copper transporter n=1 Tax=Hibiscus sabdariffa TaxID=183260 RepID=A0ABR2QVL9_9ROSI
MSDGGNSEIRTLAHRLHLHCNLNGRILWDVFLHQLGPWNGQQNVLSGSMFEFGWKVVVLGYGYGVVFGLIMGYLVFSTDRPQWLVMLAQGLQPQKLNRTEVGGGRRFRRSA